MSHSDSLNFIAIYLWNATYSLTMTLVLSHKDPTQPMFDFLLVLVMQGEKTNKLYQSYVYDYLARLNREKVSKITITSTSRDEAL